MKSNKGFTLIEIAVVLAIIAILAAIMTPIVTSYIDQARVTRAQADVKQIAQSILLYKRDTGTYPGYYLKANALNNVTVDNDCLLSGTTNGTVTLTGFSCTTKGLLESYLNVNSLGFTSPTTSNVGGSAAGYRGPYLDGFNNVDPWGTPYVVTSKHFTPDGKFAFVASAGPNTTFDTNQNQDNTTGGASFAVSGDDIAALIK